MSGGSQKQTGTKPYPLLIAEKKPNQNSKPMQSINQVTTAVLAITPLVMLVVVLVVVLEVAMLVILLKGDTEEHNRWLDTWLGDPPH